MSIFVDTGPLVALINKRDGWHEWVTNRVKEIKPPITTCEAVLSESSFILARSGIEPGYLFNFVSRGDLKVKSSFVKLSDQKRVIEIINTYSDLPTSFADACLVHLYETSRKAKVLTLDTDFNVYRTSRGEPLSLITPH